MTKQKLIASRVSKRKPPGRIYAPAVVPGYGQYIHESAARKIEQIHAQHDYSKPRTREGGHSERLPYNPHGTFQRPVKPKRPKLD
jgi:hypothetical protein